jgi:copper oxidase (laccase) domain-containing protein
MDCFIGDMNDYIRTRLTEVGLQNIRISNPIRFTYPMTNLFFSIKRVVESLLLITDDK